MTILVYATVADMVSRFDEEELVLLTDKVTIPPSTINTAKIEKALGDASAEINGYIGKVYGLPLSGCRDPENLGNIVAPPVLVRMACDIARYFLYDDRAPEEEVVRRYKAAQADLELIGKGDMLLACPLGESPGALIAVDPLNPGGETFSSFSPRKVTDKLAGDYR